MQSKPVTPHPGAPSIVIFSSFGLWSVWQNHGAKQKRARLREANIKTKRWSDGPNLIADNRLSEYFEKGFFLLQYTPPEKPFLWDKLFFHPWTLTSRAKNQMEQSSFRAAKVLKRGGPMNQIFISPHCLVPGLKLPENVSNVIADMWVL